MRKSFATLRGNRNMFRLWLGSSVSYFGSNFTLIAVLTLTHALSPQNASLGLTSFFFILPYLFAGPISGILSDRYSKRKNLIVADVVRCILVFGYFLAIATKSVHLIYLNSFLLSFFSVLFRNSQNSIVPLIVEKQDLADMNSFSHMMTEIFFVLSMVTGGFLLGAIGYKGIFLFDAATYLLSLLMIVGIKTKEPIPEDKESFTKTFMAGIRYLRGQREMLLSVSHCTIKYFAYGILNVLYVLFVYTYSKKTADEMGILYAFIGVAKIIASLVCLRLLGKHLDRRYGRIVAGALLFETVGTLLLIPSSTVFMGFVAAVMVIHAGDCFSEVAVSTRVMATCDRSFMGRTNAVFAVVPNTLYALGMLFCGFVSERLSMTSLILIAAGVFAASALPLAGILHDEK